MPSDPRLIGDIYRVGQTINRGEMLTMCTAYNRNTSDVVGLLVIQFLPSLDVQLVRQLLQPLEKRRTIQSPYVMRVFDWGIDGTRAYIVTDPPRGITLRHVLDSENIDLQRALDLARQMAQGLKVLHEHGVVGLDLRPQLITVDSVTSADHVQLDDVGLRPLLLSLGYVHSQREDDIGFLDPRYSPPEYISGGAIGPASDIYQLGLLLFELIAGRLPFVGRNAADTANLQSTGPVPRMTQFKPDTPTALQEVIDRTLAKNPDERLSSAVALLTALETLYHPHRQVPGIADASTPLIKTPYATDPTLVSVKPQVEQDITLSATRIARPTTPEIVTTPEVHADRDASKTVKVYAYLYHEKNGVEIERFAIKEKDVIVGRTDPKRNITPTIDLTSLDPKMTISRRHARIRFIGGQAGAEDAQPNAETFFSIEDLKSHNKTRLGERVLVPLKPEMLQHGDILHFGSIRLVFKIPGM